MAGRADGERRGDWRRCWAVWRSRRSHLGCLRSRCALHPIRPRQSLENWRLAGPGRWPFLGKAYVIYAWATLAVVLATPSHHWYALASNMRFMLVVFPLFMLLGTWGQRQWVDRLILICSIPLLTIFIITFLSTGWVA